MTIENDLVLGGSGFIGSHLCTSLLAKGRGVVVLDNLSMGNQNEANQGLSLIQGDINDLELLKKALHKFKPTRIFHLAANSDISRSATEPMVDITNTLGTTASLIEALAALELAPQVLFASSSAIYGRHEGKLSEQTVARPISAYGWMKLASEELLLQASRSGLIEKLLIARFPNVTGENLTHGVVYDLVRKLRSNPQTLEVLGDGSQTKPYISASLLVTALLEVFGENWRGHSVYNFAPTGTTSVRQIVNEILKNSGESPTVKFGSNPEGWPGDIPNYSLDTTKLETDFPDVILGNSDDAIVESVHWALKNV